MEVLDLLGNHVEAEVGVAFFVAAYSALRKAPVSAALLVLGDLSVQGNIKPLRSLAEPLQVAKDNGAKRALIPIENKRNFLDVPGRRGRVRRPGVLRRRQDGRDEGAGADVDADGDDRVNPAEMPPLPAAAREAGIDSLHLGRKAVESLGARGATTIGDLIDGGYLSRVGWDALGRDGGKAAWGVVQELGSYCDDEDVDWPGFWASRGVSIVPRVVKGDPDIAALARAVPALLKAALA